MQTKMLVCPSLYLVDVVVAIANDAVHTVGDDDNAIDDEIRGNGDVADDEDDVAIDDGIVDDAVAVAFDDSSDKR